MLKLIFLDIDGVLNNIICTLDPLWHKTHYDIDQRCMGLLNDLIEETGAKVVISSTWRNNKSIKTLQQILDDNGFKGEVISKTPRCVYPGSVRGNEIFAWIKENEDVYGCSDYEYHNYVILDDDSDMLLWQKDNFLCVDSYVGLTPKITYKAKMILNQPENSNKAFVVSEPILENG